MKLCSFELSKALKEKGFPQEGKQSLQWYSTEGELYPTHVGQRPVSLFCKAPYIYEAVDWLAEDKGFHVFACLDEIIDGIGYYWVEVAIEDKKNPHGWTCKYESALGLRKQKEEALSEGATKALELLL